MKPATPHRFLGVVLMLAGLLAFAGDEMRHMELNDKFGQISRFSFYDMQRNLPIDPQLFVYQGQDDWDVLQGD